MPGGRPPRKRLRPSLRIPMWSRTSRIDVLHFALHGYDENDMRNMSVLAEDLYNKIGNDAGLYAFLAGQNYTVVIYKDQTEYLQKTHLQAWSRVVSAGTTLYTYPGQDIAPALIHELTHVIFYAYMGDKAPPLRWLNEGLAMYEEVTKMSDSDRMAFKRTSSSSCIRTE